MSEVLHINDPLLRSLRVRLRDVALNASNDFEKEQIGASETAGYVFCELMSFAAHLAFQIGMPRSAFTDAAAGAFDEARDMAEEEC